MSLAVRWDPDARDVLRELARRNARLAQQIRRRVLSYAETSRGDVKKLRGAREQWRLRVGNWRVIFTFDPPGFMTVLAVVPRRDAYRS